MNIRFIYPRSLINPSKVDECYEDEFNLCKKFGLNVHLIDIENILKCNLLPQFTDNLSRIIYRGWMLNEASYTQLENRFGKQLLTSKINYFNTHYLPNWYPALEPLTIRSIVTDEHNAAETLKQFTGKVFCKDFVKSLKTIKGSCVDSPQSLTQVIADMKHYRGFIEGGIIIRDFIDLVTNSEIRFFVVNNSIFSPVEDLNMHQIVEQVVQCLQPMKLQFYSVDIATTKQGKHILIEIGDGQVSDSVGWKTEDFVALLSDSKNLLNVEN